MNRQNDATRPLDVVLFGATGFVGALTAEYLAAHAPATLRWALAGRSRTKLEKLRERLTAIAPACAELPLLETDADDADALAELAPPRVVATTVRAVPAVRREARRRLRGGRDGLRGPHGRGGVHRPDQHLEHDARARETGARLVHALRLRLRTARPGGLLHRQAAARGRPLAVDGFVRT